MKYLEMEGTYRPGLLILDSPILSLKEKRGMWKEGDRADLGMRESLFQYLIDNCGKNQIIIAENEIPNSPKMDYSKAKLIAFGEKAGREGFLMEPNDTL